MRLTILALTTLLALPATAAEFQTSAGPVEVTRIGPEFEFPWAVAFLPSGDMLVTERSGRLYLMSPEGDRRRVTGVPRVWAENQGGLLDVAISPDFERSNRIYLTYAKSAGLGAAQTAVWAGTLNVIGASLNDGQDIFLQQPALNGGRHFGSRIAFAPNGDLFVTLGDRGSSDQVQDMGNHIGKVVRLRPDGRPSPENPIVPNGFRPEIWSMGHRNPQGAAIRPSDGTLWTVEHGARGGDEINRPEAGRNYGWPVISYGRHYSGGRIGEGTEKEGMEQPEYYWDPSIAPSGLAFHLGRSFPEWYGDLFVGALRDQKIVRLDISGEEIVDSETLFEGAFGRIRDVRSGPDGNLWFVTDEPDGGVYTVTPL
ncbi:MAG: PQQ-dependent sugar dehydrogenase [Pseudomonadota bacterium]